MTARVLFHVQHLLGSGHVRRAAAIARALAQSDLEVELVSGGAPVANLDLGRARLVQLPVARTADSTFRTLIDEGGSPVDDTWRARRVNALLERFRAFAPDVVITELFPFGRRLLAFEVMPLLEAAGAQAPRPLILASLRDLLAPPSRPERIGETLARVERFYDRVLVHGDRDFIPLSDSFPATDRLGGKLVYTGYVAGPSGPPAPPGDGDDEVIVSVGGGAVGEPLIRAALAARELARERGRRWRILAGGRLPSPLRIDTYPGAGACILESERADFPGLLARCRVSVSQAGYNTVMDILNARARAVLVPFAADGETEQSARAAALAARGWAQVVPEESLDPASLAAAIDRAAGAERPDPGAVRRGGAEETARLVTAWLAAR